MDESESVVSHGSTSIGGRNKLKRLDKEFRAKAQEQYIKNVHIVVLTPGDAFNFPKNGDSCSVHYTSSLLDGTMIDDSYKRGQPINFVLGAGHVIAGWEVVLPSMSKGEKARITVPPELAYGDRGYPPIIPSNAKVVYEIELLSLSSAILNDDKKRNPLD